jgi:hypothetical protein
MELVIMSFFLFALLTSFIGVAVTIGFFVGLFYSHYYYDEAEKSGVRKWHALQETLSRLTYALQKYYFSFTVVYKGDDNLESLVREYQTKNTAIFVGAPHGLIAISSLFLVGIPSDYKKSTWRNVTPCIHRHVFAVPFLRDVALWLGAINVSRPNIVEKLKTNSVYLASGGCREMIIDANNNGIQDKHRGFLKIAYQEKKLVFPVIHRGQEHVFRTYTFRALDRLRHIILDTTGYPFPSFFLGPFPASLTSYIFSPHNPLDYNDEDTFIDSYYTKLYEHNKSI